MILLSENSEYRYFAIEVPREAETFDLSSLGCSEEDPSGLMKCSLGIGRRKDPTPRKYIELGHLCDPELLGVIVAGEEISEEVAKEVVPYSFEPEYSEDGIGKFHYHDPAKSIWFSKAVDCLKYILDSHRLLVENPIQRTIPTGSELRAGDYLEGQSDWQSYESRLVKAVILKIKK